MTTFRSPISIKTALEAGRLSSDVPFLLLLDVELQSPSGEVEKFYLVRNTESVTHNGNEYQPVYFELSIDSDSPPSASITIIDPTADVRTQLEAYDGGIGASIRISLLNAAALDAPADVSERFMVMGARANDDGSVVWTLGAENALTISFPRRRQFRDRCSWTFRSPQCTYAGDDTFCTYSLLGPHGCVEKGNQINFGGFPGLETSAIYG